MDLDRLVAGVLERKAAALARAISMVEDERPGFEQLLAALHRHTGRAHRVGITGPPGAGKSTLTQALVGHYRGEGLTVAVVAVDPSSPFSGGALLGDRIRMEAVALDDGVFIRSMATRGSLGGLAMATREACDVLDAAGFERILVETVGVGQSELDVARLADSTVLVLVPESGDGIQALKSGIMEAADLYVVNKADRPGADKLGREIEIMLGIRKGNAFRHVPAHHGIRAGRARQEPPPPDDAWVPPVVSAIAAKGDGVAELAAGIEAHRAWLDRSGELEGRRRRRLTDRTRQVVERAARRWLWQESAATGTIGGRMDDVMAGHTSPYDVANEVLDGLREGTRA